MLVTVVWGTKGRTRPVGIRASFCRGCFALRKFQVHAIEKSDHIYLVSIGGWKENLRYQECEVCHAQQQIPAEARLLSVEEAEKRSIREALEATNSAEEVSAHVKAEAAATSVPAEERRRSALGAFLAQQAAQLKRSEESTGGWAGLLFLLFIAPGALAFVYGGLPVGIGAAVGLVALLLWLQSRMIHRSAEAVIEPRLAPFLAGTGLTGKEFLAYLDGDRSVPGKLRRHFRRSRYSPHLRGPA